MNRFTMPARQARLLGLQVRGLVATRQALRSVPARSLGIDIPRPEQSARFRWDNEGGAIPR